MKSCGRIKKYGLLTLFFSALLLSAVLFSPRSVSEVKLEVFEASHDDAQESSLASTNADESLRKYSEESESLVHKKNENKEVANSAILYSAKDEQSLINYLEKLKISGNINLSQGDDGRVYQVAGALLDLQSNHIERGQFALEVGRLMAGNSVELASEALIQESALGRAYEYDQIIGGVPVFGGYVKVFSAKEKDVVYHVIQNAKRISQGILEKRFDREQVEASLKVILSAKTWKLAHPAKEYIWVSEDGTAQYCWEMVVHVSAPLKDSRTFILSSFDLHILEERSNIIQ